MTLHHTLDASAPALSAMQAGDPSDGERRCRDGATHVLIIGGGASGTLMAVHLLAEGRAMRVTMVEKSSAVGCGVAYATDNPEHLLNSRAANMSAFADDPDHFVRWLEEDCGAPVPRASFPSRSTYGRYLESIVATCRGRGLTCVSAECRHLTETAEGVVAKLDDGTVIRADIAILATGHALAAPSPDGMQAAWDFTPPSSTTDRVVIVGTGLSMIDHVVSLIGAGHQGPITCMSRRGLLPRPHVDDLAERSRLDHVPVGSPVSVVLRWLRGQAVAADLAGRSWRDVMDSLRPHISAIWQSWDLDTRRRFLRHGTAWWEVHRHRMPPTSAAFMARTIATGQVRIVRARHCGTTHVGAQKQVLARVADGMSYCLPADHVIDCRGLRRDPETDSPPVIRELLASGLGRLDPLRLGLETTLQGRLVARTGAPSSRLYAIGPCARGTLWEITAVPDIRAQCASLAKTLA